MKTIYLAGPITGLTHEQATAWRLKAANSLHKSAYREIRIIDPMQGEADTLSEGDPILASRVDEIVKLDHYYVRECDIVLANFTEHVPAASVGTISEIAWAWDRGKIVVAVVPDGSPYNRAWMDVMYTFKVKTLDEALKIVSSIQ